MRNRATEMKLHPSPKNELDAQNIISIENLPDWEIQNVYKVKKINEPIISFPIHEK